MHLIHNERTKLLAGVFNTAATSAFAVGVLAPIAAVFYNLGGPNRIALSTLVAGVLIWLSAAGAFGGKTHSRRTEGMTDIQLFAFVILPISIVVIAWGIVFLNEWYNRQHPHSG